MRLHHLEVTAFGPFADEVTVDFDALSDAGLFLLAGATGAGKTSVLDAVCFALYGEVPGDRQTAKRLRSDQAAEGVRPSVGLELTLSGRRFRIVRSPAWERPKKRGSGSTTEQASVRLSERRDGAWHQLANRLDETGHLVTHLVGMNLAQFCQVAMLPQGRFQAFLRARSDERHKLLQQLFRTTRFEDIERWLRDHRRSLRQQSARHHEVVADLVSRVSETADVPLPDAWDPHDLTGPADTGEIDHWSALQRERAAAHAAETADLVRLAFDRESRSRATLDQAGRLGGAPGDPCRRARRRDRLRAQGHDQSARVHRLSAARRAAAVQPLHEIAVRQQRVCADALALRDRRTSIVAGLLEVDAGSLDARAIGEAGQQAIDAAARTRALQPREDALATLHTAVRTTEERVAVLASEESAAAAQLREPAGGAEPAHRRPRGGQERPARCPGRPRPRREARPAAAGGRAGRRADRRAGPGARAPHRRGRRAAPLQGGVAARPAGADQRDGRRAGRRARRRWRLPRVRLGRAPSSRECPHRSAGRDRREGRAQAGRRRRVRPVGP